MKAAQHVLLLLLLCGRATPGKEAIENDFGPEEFAREPAAACSQNLPRPIRKTTTYSLERELQTVLINNRETDRQTQRETETDRDTHRQRETEAHREADRQRDRRRETETERERERDRQADRQTAT